MLNMNKDNSLSIPGAIVIAGLLIAGGIYLSKPSLPNTAKNNQPASVGSSDISLKAVSADDHILGNPNAPVIMVEYSDLECPFCKIFHVTMNTIMDTYGKDGKVAWVYRHFPLDSIHPKTRKEAEASECANELGGNSVFWKYIDEVFNVTTSNNTLPFEKLAIIAKDVGLDVNKFNDCLSSGKYAEKVEAQFEDGEAAGSQGTPYNVMILKNKLSTDTVNNINQYIANNGLGQNITIPTSNNKIVLNGALPLDIVKKILDLVLQ